MTSRTKSLLASTGIISDTHRMSLGSEYRLWYLKDLLALLKSASVPQDDVLVMKARKYVETIDSMYPSNELGYFEALNKATIYQITDRLIQKHEKQIMKAAGGYASRDAEKTLDD